MSQAVSSGLRPHLEAMESRVLLSAYSISGLASFGLVPNGSGPDEPVVVDSGGNLYGTTPQGGPANAGTVFEVAKGTNTLTTLGSFDRTDGRDPESNLVLDLSGNLYGTAEAGGANNDGTVFEIAHGSGSITTLASFNGTNGITPSGHLALDPSGVLYGTTSVGGAKGHGTVFAFRIGSTAVTSIASFSGSNGAQVNAGVTLDSFGDLFGTTYLGGASNDGTAFEIANGSTTITTLASFSTTTGTNPVGTTLDAMGNLYGIVTQLSQGGMSSGDYGKVFEIGSGSAAITILASFNRTNGFEPSGRLTLDASGDLFGTTLGITGGNGSVFEIARGSNAISTVFSFNNTDGATPAAGLILDATGNFYGTTINGGLHATGTVFEMPAGSTAITTLASFGPGVGYHGNTVAINTAGNLFGTTSAGDVFELAKGSNLLTELAAFNGGTNGGLTFDASGNLYATSAAGGANGKGSVFKMPSGSTSLEIIASFDGTDGATPYGALTIDAIGNIFGVTRSGGANNDGTVFEIANGSNAITTLASFNGADGSSPVGVTLDASGNLYGATMLGGTNNDGTLFENASGTNAITTLATFNGTNGANPNAVTFDASGNLFGTTYDGASNNEGTAFEIPNGSATLTTFASFGPTTGEYPSALTIDAAGNLYGTAQSNGAFEIAKGSTAITVLATFTGSGPGGTFPEAGLTVDGSGNLYGTTTNGGAAGYGALFELSPNPTPTVTLKLTSGANPSTTSQPLTFTAAVTDGVPNGETVTLIDASNNNATVATGTLSGGSATLTVPAGTLAVGTHNLVAAYGGNASFAASQSAAYTQTVQAAPPPPAVAGAPVINGDDPNGLFNAAGQPTPGVQRSMVEDIVYTFNEPVTIPDANAAFTVVGAGPHAGTAPSTLLATAVPGTNGTQWAVSLTGKADGILASIANGEYSITLNPNAVFAAADGTTAMTAGETDTFFRLFGDINGDRVVNVSDEFQFSKAMNTYNRIFDVNGDGTVNLADEFQASKSFSSGGYVGDGFVTSI